MSQRSRSSVRVTPAPVRLPAVTLPVNLERVTRMLTALPATDEGRSLLKLSYYLEVYGRAPRLDLLRGFDLHTGPA